LIIGNPLLSGATQVTVICVASYDNKVGAAGYAGTDAASAAPIGD